MTIVLIINLLITIFISLIFYQIFFNLNNKLKEGMDDNTTTSATYQDYSADPLILAQQNAGNIEYLKQQVQDLTDLNKTVVDLSNNYVSLYQQVQGLVQQQQEYGTQLNGGSTDPITITGTDLSSSSNTDDVSGINTSSTVESFTVI